MKILKRLRKMDFADVGIGSMIVFIAMVLVAGIAASVLIQTAGKLETQAMQSGQETIAEVSSGIAVVDVCGAKGTSDLQYLAVTVRPRAGAPDIDLNETRVILSDGVTKTVLMYNGWTDAGHYNASVHSNGRLFSTGNWSDLTFEEFGIIVLQDADNSVRQTTPVINQGDQVVLKICCSATGCFAREIPERTDVFGRVVPEVGSPGIIAFTTPAAYNDGVFDLQ